MANEINISYEAGSTLYARVFSLASQTWNTTSVSFEAWNPTNVTDYSISLSDSGGAKYYGNFPSDIAEGTYFIIAYLQDGGSATVSDSPVSSIGIIEWDGSAEIPQEIGDLRSTLDKFLTMIETDGPVWRYTSNALEQGPSGGLQGDGSVVVDWDYDGNDFRYLSQPGDVGILDATVYAYLKSDYDNNRREAAYIKAQTWTNVLGQWRHAMNLNPETYVLYFFKRGQYGPDTQEVTVV